MANPPPSETALRDPEEALARLDEELRFRAYAETTRRTYRFHVEQFLDALAADTPESNEGIRSHVFHCIAERNYSLSYTNQAVCALKFFYRFVRPDIMNLSRFPTLRRPRSLPTVLSRREVAAVFEQTALPKYRAILMLIYSSGLRVSEAVQLKPSDIDREPGVLRVSNGKGGTEWFAIFSQFALSAVEAHWPQSPSNEWVFHGQSQGAHIHKRSVQRAFAGAREAAGISKNGGVHTLRHSFATHLLERGTPLIYLQKLLGHNSPRSTLVYIHVTQEELSRIRNPLDELLHAPAVSSVEAAERQDREVREVAGLAILESSPNKLKAVRGG